MKNDSFKTAGEPGGMDLAFSGEEFRDWLELNEAIDEAGQVACANFPEIYFSSTGENITYEYRLAKRMCNECPIRTQCLSYAIKWDVSGIWGGMSERERNQAKSMMRLKARA
jgi:WhiB family redox-sensing transcriptional regulator